MKSQKSKTIFLDKNPIHTIRQSFNHSKGRTLVWMYGCMKLLNIKITFLIISTLFLSACDKGPPIPEEKFIKVYVDLLIIQDTKTAETFPLDSIKTLVFTKHNILSEQYDETINYYNSQPEKWVAFFDSATVYVERLKRDSEKKP
ncbi:MAG TPA: DUF4296 domain-containing protein [Ignavibacteriaceae bacterium]|nr:DUF4296 domain-containing protein [Ignavibacteriaceae bacterium]